MKRILLLIFIVLTLFSCKTVEQATTTYQNKVDTVYISKYIRDSIWQHDSIYIKEANDTVWMKEWHTRIVDNSRIDTVYENHTDTCYVENTITLPPEKYIPKWIVTLLVITGIISVVALGYVIIKIVVKVKTGGITTLLSKLKSLI